MVTEPAATGTQPGYREWRPAPALARHVRCTWAGRVGDDGTLFTDTVLPDGCADLIWDGTRLFVAGPDTEPVPVAHPPGGIFVGIRFRPGLAPTFLGVPASELVDARVDAGVVVGDWVDPLTERLPRTPGPLRRAALELESALIERLPEASAPDPLVEAAVAALHGSSPPAVAGLAEDLGVSERRLHRHCRAAVGYGPKTLDRILRFRRFLALAAGTEPSLAVLAAVTGYADQAHLTRECRRLAGTTPARLVRRAEPPGRQAALER